MEKNKLVKIEETYLQIFKIGVIVLLTIALIASIFLVLKGLSEMMASPSKADPEKSASKPSVSIDKFLNEFDPKEKPAAPKPVERETQPAPKDTSLDDMTDAYLAKLWNYYDGYQKSCQVPVQVDKDTFLRTFPRHVIRGWFSYFGKDFAESQDAFEKSLLSNKRVIEICKNKDGKAGTFTRSLDWHRDEWQRQLVEIDRFEQKERNRVAQFEREEKIRVAIKHAQAPATLFSALTAFGVFLSLAMLLIFAKIESNLRGIKVLEKEVS